MLHFLYRRIWRYDIEVRELILVCYKGASPTKFPQHETKSVHICPFERVKLVHGHCSIQDLWRQIPSSSSSKSIESTLDTHVDNSKYAPNLNFNIKLAYIIGNNKLHCKRIVYHPQEKIMQLSITHLDYARNSFS